MRTTLVSQTYFEGSREGRDGNFERDVEHAVGELSLYERIVIGAETFAIIEVRYTLDTAPLNVVRFRIALIAKI